MKTIIAGSRSITNYNLVEEIIRRCPWPITKILEGGAKGVDKCAYGYAMAYEVKHEKYPANWETHGKSAGPIRNAAMAKDADALIAIWDGESPGTRNMIAQAISHRLKIYVEVIK
jgi:hypothetical protein